MSRIVITVIGSVVPGTIAKLVVVPEPRSVNKNAKTSLNPHCHCPYSLEANIKSKLKSLEIGTKSNCKKAVSVIGSFCPVLALIASNVGSLLEFTWLLKLVSVYGPSVRFAIPVRKIIPSVKGKADPLPSNCATDCGDEYDILVGSIHDPFSNKFVKSVAE